MRPKIQDFEAACERCRGNLTKVAEAFGVERITIYAWCKSNPKFQNALDNQRGKALDTYLNTADALARGVPKLDKDKKFIGWKVQPDSKVLMYLIGKYGYKEGFGDRVDVTSNGESIKADPVVVEIIDSREKVAKEEEGE